MASTTSTNHILRAATLRAGEPDDEVKGGANDKAPTSSVEVNEGEEGETNSRYEAHAKKDDNDSDLLWLWLWLVLFHSVRCCSLKRTREKAISDWHMCKQ